MRRVSLSLAAVAAVAVLAQADIKSESFDGSASLFYGTNDASNGDLFDKGTSYGNAAVEFGGVSSVGDGSVKLNYGVTGVSTMGLENTLVSSTWVTHTDALNDGVWIDTLNLTFNPLDSLSNSAMVVGRQELATPMVFTETWNIARNSYDAAVFVNNDIKETTLVGGWIGRSNVAGGSTVKVANIGNGFSKFLTDEGAYAAGLVTGLIPATTVQAWYYVAPAVAHITWAQADAEIVGLSIGAQFGNWDPEAGDGGNGFGVKLGYEIAGLGLSAAYSSVEEGASFVNLGGAQTPLYTAGWWDVGSQGLSDTDAFNVTATYAIKDVADLGIYYTSWDDGSTTNEIAATAGTSLGNLDVTLAYIYTDIETADDAVSDVQVYTTYNF